MTSLLRPVADLSNDDRLILIQGNDVLLCNEEYIWKKEGMAAVSDLDQVLLVEEGESRLLVADIEKDVELPDYVETSSLRGLLFKSEQALLTAGKASQYLHWIRSHRFCGFCGTSITNSFSPTASTDETALVCGNCGHHFFPRISPCVIMLVVRGKEILLARNARYRTGFFSCLAGFVEAGESAEDTVYREVKEESGLEVHNLRYFKSQSWPFPSQLMLGFYAEYKSGDIVPEEGEIEEADWYSIDDLPMIPSPKISIAGELIHHYVEMMRNGQF